MQEQSNRHSTCRNYSGNVNKLFILSSQCHLQMIDAAVMKRFCPQVLDLRYSYNLMHAMWLWPVAVMPGGESLNVMLHVPPWNHSYAALIHSSNHLTYFTESVLAVIFSHWCFLWKHMKSEFSKLFCHGLEACTHINDNSGSN